MPSGLHRTYGAHHLHFITWSCYRRLPFLRSARTRDRFLSILEQVRARYRFVVVGYVVMLEHVHFAGQRAGDRNSFQSNAGFEAAHGASLAAQAQAEESAASQSIW